MGTPKRLSGNETFHANGKDLKLPLLKFWQWVGSDLRSNAMRGRLAEYLVARDLGLGGGVRREWLAHDLTAKDGTRVEVKSAAYVQSWTQRRPSLISFDIRPTLGWDPDTAKFGDTRCRQSDVYVFSLLHEKDEAKMDPLNVAHWQFFVLATQVLNEHCSSQKTITLRKLQALKPEEVTFGNIAAAVRSAVSGGRRREHAV